MDSIKVIFINFQESRLVSIFPTLKTSILISLTLSVTSVSTERSFSKLKLIKTRLRTTMAQTRSKDLMIISCERDIYVQYKGILKNFIGKSTIMAKYL